MKFPNSSCWHVQLSERPPIILDVQSATFEGEEIFYLRKRYATREEAETAIGSLARDWQIEAGEWQI